MDKLKTLLILCFAFLLCSMSDCEDDAGQVIGSGNFSGKVQEKGSNAPIEGVKVVLTAVIDESCLFCGSYDTLSGETHTDAQGNFTIDYKVYERGVSYEVYVNADPFAVDTTEPPPFNTDHLINSDRRYTYLFPVYPDNVFTLEQLDDLKKDGLEMHLRPLVPFTFRVRNVNAYDSNDVFRTWYGTSGIYFYDDVILHSGTGFNYAYLEGDDIDASIPTHALKDSTLQFQYMVTRNDSNSIDSVVFNPTQTNNFMLIEY